MMQLLFWLVFCATLAAMQGFLMPAIRRTPPGLESKEQAFALHWLGTIAYFLPVWLAPSLLSLAEAFVARVVLFDIVLNFCAQRPVFEVGQTALSDRLLRKVDNTHPERLNALVKLTVAVVAGVLYYIVYA